MRPGLSSRIRYASIIAAAFGLAVFGLTTVQADHDPGGSAIDIIAFDMDVAGNTATHVETIEDCVSLSAIGQTAVVDLVADQIPAYGIGGFETNVLYNPAVVKVAAVQGSLLLAASGASGITSYSNAVPDTDGNFRASFLDSSVNYESGEGVLLRLTFEAVGTGKATLSTADLEYGLPFPNIYAPDTSSFDVTQNIGGTISVGTACSSAVDLQASPPGISSAASAGLGAPFNVVVSGSVQNNGPVSPVNADTTVTLNTPSDCTAAGGNQHSIQDQSLSVGSPLAINETFSVTCTSPSFHSFTATIAVVLDDPSASESATGNNQATSPTATTAIVATADLAVTSVSVTTSQVTATPMSGASFTLTATIGVTNNGTAGPVAASGLASPVMPADCTVWSSNDPEAFTVQPGASQTVNAVVAFHVRCATPGDHVLGLSASVVANDVHVVDASGNNSGSGSASFPFKVASCGPDPAPGGINPSPALLALIQQLTAEGTPVPEAFKLQIDCQFEMIFSDSGNSPTDDCPVGVPERPCGVSFPLALDLVGGSPAGRATAQLNPIGIVFAPLELDWANDTEVTNGSVSGSGSYAIRTDAGLLPQNVSCSIDASFATTMGREGGILGNVPESNLGSDFGNPNVWPNNLNAEKALVEDSFANPITGAPGVTLWSRTIVPLQVASLKINMNILTWKVTDPAFIALTGAGWVIVPFPGDVVNPDAPGTIGGNPDADDPPAPLSPLHYCMPHHVTLSFNGMAGGTVFLSCTSAGGLDPFGWVLVDPDATNVKGDDGQRSDTSTCSVDTDGDGLGSTSETYWGTNPANVDTDADGINDGPDNCKVTPNVSQADYDSDGVGDACDPDIDADGTANASDLCPLTVVGAPADANGCSKAQVDSDGDDVCNPSAPSTGPAPCTGSDLCPNTAAGDAVDPVAGCSKAQVDGDGDDWCDPGAPSTGPVPCTRTDNCPTVANPSQANADGDSYGDACEHPNCLTIVNHWTVPDGDSDCDGYPNTTPGAPYPFRAPESVIGTLAANKCAATPVTDDEPGTDAWPVDFNDNQLVNGADILSFNPHFGSTASGGGSYNVRWDLNANGIINGADILQFNPFFGKRCA